MCPAGNEAVHRLIGGGLSASALEEQQTMRPMSAQANKPSRPPTAASPAALPAALRKVFTPSPSAPPPSLASLVGRRWLARLAVAAVMVVAVIGPTSVVAAAAAAGRTLPAGSEAAAPA
eukprot:CAMPEP_0119481270 /NCGR_PEP_ID=MMETSP1344-20130328/9692_1 /TAXON_ID=236787 /ORGANISM="Florenciella parvula, Strain CCMP2471" /LENGTH=118 /DNA_ID=CAMNT_0007515637 /DNA_START=247 /DNA_END=600 /DNA_ORIENTATION=-